MSFRSHLHSFGVVTLLGALMLFGCRSRLRVVVDVYTGPLVESEQTRIAKAVGTARAMRDVALRVAGQQYRRADKGLPAFYVHRDQDYGHAGPPSARRRGAFDFDLLGAPNADYVVMDSQSNLPPNEKLTAKVYVNKHASLGQLFAALDEYLDIDGLYGDYRNAGEPTERGRDSIDRGKDVRRKLFAVLNSFGDACAAIARYVGFKEIPMLWLSGHRLDVVQASVMLDESARLLQIQVDSISHRLNSPHGVEQSEISALMASQAPGPLVLALSQNLFLKGRIKKLFTDIYWKRINTVKVEGSGDVKIMLVKDEIGNWHLKQAVMDPSKVINAIGAASVAAVKLAAAAYGVPVPLGQNASAGQDTPAEAGAGETSENARVTEVLQTLLGDVIVVPSMNKGKKDALLQALDKAIKQL